MPPRNNVDNRQMGTKRNEERGTKREREREGENEKEKTSRRGRQKSTVEEEDIREKRECKVERKARSSTGEKGES